MTDAARAPDAAPISVRVRFFALQRRQLGRAEDELRLPPGTMVGDAWRELVARYPLLAEAGESMRFAVNGSYAGASSVLQEGDELALIPPIAGGADQPAAARVTISGEPITDHEINALRAAIATPSDGAVVVFVGQTRATPGTPAPGQEREAARHAGRVVQELEYEAFEPMATRVIELIADEAEARFGVSRLAIRHRLGRVAVGETSVVIAAAAAHREAAFEATRYAIEELKARAPIWKCERFADGELWIGQPARSGPLRAEAPLEPRS